MYSGIRLRTVTGTVAIALAAGLGSVACSSNRWCEFDATDTKVADSYCENGTPGYEWEPDSDGKKKPSKPTTSKRKH
ncbi:MAG: hypothetical protein HOQ36_02385 [Nocardia sp.]|nr:hypothetical protein [Nocardia sp.]